MTIDAPLSIRILLRGLSAVCPIVSLSISELPSGLTEPSVF